MKISNLDEKSALLFGYISLFVAFFIALSMSFVEVGIITKIMAWGIIGAEVMGFGFGVAAIARSARLGKVTCLVFALALTIFAALLICTGLVNYINQKPDSSANVNVLIIFK